MKILHITPHLGGGVGKAHAALGAALPEGIERTFLLLEEPRDSRHADAIAASGATVVVDGFERAADLAAAADIVQFEFWNHPRLFECLARVAFPAMRTVLWSHVSGLSRPLIPPDLIEQAGRFVFTTEASRAMAGLADVPVSTRNRLAVINSGFGFAGAARRASAAGRNPIIAYLGTVDFVKMHPGFFDVIDSLDGEAIRVCIWGDASDAVVARARAMRYPERVQFGGRVADAADALSGADIFFYPLQPDHYGTAENALVEAMSLGLVAVVMNNPAEMAIVRHENTGFVARSMHECAALLQRLMCSPELLDRVGRNAICHVAETRTPAQSARAFMLLWLGLLAEPKRMCDFRRVVGDTPAQWFLATQCLPGESWDSSPQEYSGMPAKGTLAHFDSVFPGDASLSRLAPAGGEPPSIPRAAG